MRTAPTPSVAEDPATQAWIEDIRVHRGDAILSGDKRNYGFEINTAEHYDGEPLPWQDVFPSDVARENDFMERLHTGNGVTLVDADSDRPVDLLFSPDVYLEKSDLLDSGVMAFGTSPRIQPGDSRYGILKGRFPREEEQALRREVEDTNIPILYKNPQRDHLALEFLGDMSQRNISEIFDFTEGGNTIRVVNLGDHRMRPVHLRQLSNAMRAASESHKSAGRLFEKVRIVAILPKADSLLTYEYENGEKVQAAGSAYRDEGVVLLSDISLEPPAPSQERKKDSFFSRAKELGRTALSFLGPKQIKPKGNWHTTEKTFQINFEDTAYHELVHMMVPNEQEAEFAAAVEGDNPVTHGQWHVREDVAESATGEFMGGWAAQRVNTSRRKAMKHIWSIVSKHPEPYEPPKPGEPHLGPRREGPAYVRCREVNIGRLVAERFELRKPVRIKSAPQYVVDRAKKRELAGVA